MNNTHIRFKGISIYIRSFDNGVTVKIITDYGVKVREVVQSIEDAAIVAHNYIAALSYKYTADELADVFATIDDVRNGVVV